VIACGAVSSSVIALLHSHPSHSYVPKVHDWTKSGPMVDNHNIFSRTEYSMSNIVRCYRRYRFQAAADKTVAVSISTPSLAIARVRNILHTSPSRPQGLEEDDTLHAFIPTTSQAIQAPPTRFFPPPMEWASLRD